MTRPAFVEVLAVVVSAPKSRCCPGAQRARAGRVRHLARRRDMRASTQVPGTRHGTPLCGAMNGTMIYYGQAGYEQRARQLDAPDSVVEAFATRPMCSYCRDTAERMRSTCTKANSYPTREAALAAGRRDRDAGLALTGVHPCELHDGDRVWHTTSKRGPTVKL